MRRLTVSFAVMVAMTAGCLASALVIMGAAEASSAPTTLPIQSISTTSTTGAPGANAPTGTILMIKLYVGNVSTAETVYGSASGAKAAIKVGTVPILTFPKGGPGLVLPKKGSHDKNKVGGFIIQVPNLAQAKATAIAHGAKAEGNFAGTPSGKAAQSVDLLDPWGNNVEILQIG